MQVTKYQSEEQRGREDGENCTGKKNIHIGPEREKESGEEKTARNLDGLFYHLLQPRFLLWFNDLNANQNYMVQDGNGEQGSKGGMFCRAQTRNIAKGAMGPRVKCSESTALTKVTSFYRFGCRAWGQKAKIYDTGCKLQMISWTYEFSAAHGSF